jgi:hypothetical protein
MSKLITSTDLSTYMQKSLNAGVAEAVVEAMNTWVETRTLRCWGETKQVTERYNWKRILWLRHQDVVTVDSITLGFPGQTQTALPPNAYFVNSFGRITLYASMLAPGARGGAAVGSPIFNDYMQVMYTYGVPSDQVPNDLILAVLGIGATFYNFTINGQKDVVASSVGSYHVQFSGAIRPTPGAISSGHTDEANYGIVDSYRTRRQ